jgi:hypothetical protein
VVVIPAAIGRASVSRRLRSEFSKDQTGARHDSMKDDDCNDDTQSFILRIWNDSPAGSEKMKSWRGSIVHVGSGKRVYFHNLNSIPPFIQKQTGMRSTSVGDWFKSLFGKTRQKQN